MLTTQTTSLLVSAREAAAALSISERTLWSLTAKGEIPCVRIGRAVRYSRRELEQFVAARLSVSRPEKSQ